ncbi:ATP-grasp domain-containing protein [Temperatibacter marinus]|uniref:ATP-grasp domain-containing protein n=1 Tax=Temperatibacter marinus TaxID=1456591 RepID=A0AA52EEN3_9PROT|nr:ATP-grasp domain-containing protein [Temperatibacter marinus]WND03406.1 ATP-grasp domain-containing protein [Temperatibacter marinus]
MSGISLGHMLFDEGAPLRLKEEDKARLKVLFLAKHALAGGKFDKNDGIHSLYHDEIKHCLENLVDDLAVQNSYEALYEASDRNFIFTLFNRGGFRNSEILASCLSEYHSTPYLGAPPSMRGFADDKHLTKLLYGQLGIPTPRWQIYRTSDLSAPAPSFEADRYVVKPNNSSASWGINHGTDWDDLRPFVQELLRNNHDVIVEEYVPGEDVTVPSVGAGRPWILYPMLNPSQDDLNIVTYEQKRGFKGGSSIELFKEREAFPELVEYTKKCNTMIWPYDYGRFDYRIEPNGKVWALEFNLSCNLGQGRAIVESAKELGFSQQDIVESVLANSVERQRVMFEAVCNGEQIRWQM